MQSAISGLDTTFSTDYHPHWLASLGAALEAVALLDRFLSYRSPSGVMIIIDLAESGKILTQIAEQFHAVGHNLTGNQLIMETSKRFAISENLMDISGFEEKENPDISLLVSDSCPERYIVYLCHQIFNLTYCRMRVMENRVYNGHSLRPLGQLQFKEYLPMVFLHWMIARHFEIATFRFLQKLANQPSSEPLKATREVAYFLVATMVISSEIGRNNASPPVCDKSNQRETSLRAKMSRRMKISPVN